MAVVCSLSHQLPRPLQHFAGLADAVQGPGPGPGEQGPIAFGVLLDIRPHADPGRLGRRPRQPAVALLWSVCAVVPGPGPDGFRWKPGRADLVSPVARHR